MCLLQSMTLFQTCKTQVPFSHSTLNKSAKESEHIPKSKSIDTNEKSNTLFQFESEDSFGAPRRLSESLKHELGEEEETL